MDGAHSQLPRWFQIVRDIVDELSERFPGAPVATDVPPFLERLRQEGWRLSHQERLDQGQSWACRTRLCLTIRF